MTTPQVPKYISQRWEAVASAAEGGVSEEVGKIRIVKSDQAKEQDVTLILPDKLLEMDVSSSQDAPSTSAAKPESMNEAHFSLISRASKLASE